MVLDMLNESNLFDTRTEEENFLENVEAIVLDENEDPVSACYRITMENERNWFNIMNTIAFSELAFLESHGPEEVMYEAADFKKIKDTIIAFIQNAWAKLKGVIQKAISNLSSIFSADKRLCAAYEKKVKDKPELANKVVTVAKHTVLVQGKDQLITDFIKGVGDDAHNQFDELWNFTNYADTTLCHDKIEKFKSEKFEFLKAEELKDAIYNTSEVKINAKAAFAKVKSGKHVNDLKNALKAEQKEFNDLLATFKKEKSAEAGSNLYKNATDVVSLKSKYVKQVISVLNMSAKACIQAVNKDYAKHRSILKAIVGGKGEDLKAEEKKEEKKVNESVDLICDLI